MAFRTDTPPTEPTVASPTPHALYDLRDVEDALRGGRQRFVGDLSDDDGLGIRHLQSMIEAGETGRWRTLANATSSAMEAVSALGARAPHMRTVIDLVVRRLRAAQVTGVPTTLPPMLLLGAPGVGKTWLMGRVGAALGIPFRCFGMNLATLGDSLSGSHPVWKAAAPGLVAKTLLREAVANPLILVDELDKPPPRHVGGDLYRAFYSLLEPETARSFVDDHLGIPMDASRVMWVSSANRVDDIPEPILDRLTVIEVGAMTRDDRREVLRSVYTDANASFRGFFDPDVAPALLDRLSESAPRRARLAVEDAMTRAAAEGRRTVRASDVCVNPTSRKTTARSGLH